MVQDVERAGGERNNKSDYGGRDVSALDIRERKKRQRTTGSRDRIVLKPSSGQPFTEGMIDQICLHGGYTTQEAKRPVFFDWPMSLIYLAPRPGLEPGTCGLTVRVCNQYWPVDGD